MTGEPVLLDCDPGHDDVMAILTAARYADLIAITTVAGNAALEYTTRNALVTCDLAGIHVPVHSGAAGPLSGPTHDAAHVHGNEGLDGVEIPAPKRAVDGTDAPAFIVETAARTPKLWIVAVGTPHECRARDTAGSRAGEADRRHLDHGRRNVRQRHPGGRVQHLGRSRGRRGGVREWRADSIVRSRPHAPGLRRR